MPEKGDQFTSGLYFQLLTHQGETENLLVRSHLKIAKYCFKTCHVSEQMSDISLRGWKVPSGEIMIQKSLSKTQKKKKIYQALCGNSCKYLKLCLQQYRNIDQNLPENRNKTSVPKDERWLCVGNLGQGCRTIEG